MEAYVFTSVGLFGIVMLISGILLTAVTMIRMFNGQLSLPGWSKVLLSIAMIAMVLIMVLRMLPPDVIEITNPFVEEHIHIVTPIASADASIPFS